MIFSYQISKMNFFRIKNILILSVGFIYLVSCSKETSESIAVYDNTPYSLEIGHFPEPNLPSDNHLTIEGVKLGRMLFYEKMLSKDNSQSCASCHDQNNAFTDTSRFSIGVEQLPGHRQAMSVFNMAWNSNAFFWDGRSEQLRDQALLPIQDPLEMNETLENVIDKLTSQKVYRDQFIRAFDTEVINAQYVAIALEQFMLSIVSTNSKFDQYKTGSIELTESEERGRILFETEYNPFFPELSGADCAHCHGGINFENDRYMNNGMDTDEQFVDFGREEATNLSSDRAKFKVPTLRNITLTAPYMHDGRFQTLEEVIDHYNEHIVLSSTIDPALIQVADNGGLQLTEQDKIDLINFLETLTDETFLQNPAYSNPF